LDYFLGMPLKIGYNTQFSLNNTEDRVQDPIVMRNACFKVGSIYKICARKNKKKNKEKREETSSVSSLF